MSITINGTEFDTIQEAIDAAEEGQTVVLSNGSYAESFTLRSGVSLEGESEAGVVITGTMSTPADFADATVSSLTVTNASATAMLLDMRGTSSVTDILFDHVTFSLGAEFTGPAAIGNGQVSGPIAVHDGDDAGDAGLTFQNVTMASNDLLSPGSVAFVYTTIESVDGAKMLLDHVNLTGATVGSDLGAQWNMTTPNNAASASVEIIASSTGLGGNFYISGFDSVHIEDNVFDGQGLALNGVENAQVIGNTFQNIDDTYTANGTQHRGLVIEDAWGTDGASDITVTGNTFTNIDAVDGAIAFQRFTDSGTATIDRLSDIDIHGNTFTDLGAGVDPIYVNDEYFGEDAVLPADFEGSQLRIGSAGTDTVTYVDAVTIQATDDGVWTVTSGDGTETLSDVEIVNDAAAGKILLVGNGGYATIQEAILAAASGDTLFLAPGTYDGIVDILGKELTITSGNAGKNPSEWADGSEVVIDRISTDSTLTVDGIHVHATHVGAGWVNGGTWESIGFVGDSTETLTVRNSVLSIDAGGAPDADQGFGFNITYDTGDITIDNTVIGPFEGGFDNPSVSNYGAWINGSLDTGRDITITNNTFDLGTPRQIGLAFDGQVGGPQLDVSGNHFGPVGTAPGAVRVFDFNDSLDEAQDYSGVTGNTFADPPGSRGLMTNETNIDGSGNGVTVTFGSGDYSDDASYDSVIDASDASTGQSLSGSAGSDLINGSAFNDTINGGAGDDAINGGDGVDTAVYGQSIDVSMLASNGPNGWTVTTDGAEGTDTLSGVEKVDGTEGGRILLVGSGGYATIQAAIDAATGDDTIYIGAGTYTGNVVIDVDGLTIIAEEGAVLQGTFRSDNTGVNPATSIGAHETVADYLFRTTAYSGASGAGITIQADGVTIQNLEVRGYNTGVELANGTDGASLTNMTITETVNGIRKGSGAAVTDLTVTGGEITDSSFGMYIAKETAAGLDLDGLTISGTSFSNLTQKGIYAETLSDALITGITMTEVGELGRGPAFGGTLANGNLGGFGAGIDINLKWDHEGANDAYSNIVIEDFTFTNVGSSNQGGAGEPHFGGAAIAIKARDDAPSYSSEGASFDGAVIVRDGTIIGTSVGIRVGEPNKANSAGNVTGPDVEVSGVSVDGALVADANNVSKSVLTVEMAAGDTIFVAQDGPTSTGAIEVTGTDGNDSITTASGDDAIDGGAGNDMLDGGAGADAMSGGAGDDTYMVDNAGDTTVEEVGEGTDTVITADSHTLSANVENLTLVDLGSNTQTFDDMALGPISNGENGWRDIGAADDQGIVDLDGNQVWRISSDPASSDFGGPYSPSLSVSAGEPQTTADGEFHSVKFRVKAVSETPDNSRLEVDFANTAGTDRNNFMVIESVAGGGLRIAVNEPTLEGEWSNNSFTAFTGNRELVSGVDSSIWHDIELRLTYVDGADNDVVQVYLDGALIGTTTTFENYRDALGGSHEANVEANQTARVVFRGSNSGQPTDGPGGQNQGFYFDNLSSTVAHHASGTGNDLANVITGNSGDNVLSGLAGNDTILGGDGNDTIIGGTGEDDLSGGAGDDTFVEVVGEGVDTIDGGAGTDTLQLVGTDGNDSFTAIVSGGQLTNPGETLTSIENITLDLGGEAGDTLSYAGTTEGVTVDLGTGSATGFTSIAGVENVTGGSGADSLTGNAGNNVLAGGGGNDTIVGGGGVDTAVYAQSIEASMVAANGSGGWTVTTGGAEGTDTLAGIEKVDGAEDGQILLVGNGGFATIQAAIDAASAGDTILVAAGEYEGNVLIDKAVTLRGANAGIDGNGTRGAESVILGKIDVTSTAAVTIDGFEVLNTGATTGGGPTNPALWFATGGSGAGHLVTHTVFNSIVAGGANGVDDRAIGMGPIATGAVRIEDNLFTGASDGKYGTASWGRGIWSDGGGVTLSITGNEFHSTRSSINYDGPDGASSAHLTIEGNTFDVAGTAMSFAAGGDVTGITGNTFNDVDTDFNFQNISNAVTLDLGATENLPTDGQPMVVLGGSAADTITGSVGTDVLQGNGGADTLNGGGGDDNLSGGAGDDILDGGTGADAMAGGADNDTYVVDNAGDVVTEAASAGTDLVQSSIDYTLGDNLENLTLVGAAIVGSGNSLNNTIVGNAQDNELNGDAGNDILEGGDGQDTLSGGIGNDVLRGGAGDDLLLGSTGNDVLDGGAGIDTMRGGTDDDTYVVDNADDSILESVNQGVDTVEASIGWTLGSNLENLTLTGADNIDGTGNGLANILIGNAGSNVLDGGAGADQMAGGLGDDTYVVDDAGDTVTEGASAGTDLVRSSVSYTLSANVENLTLTGLGNIDATGNALDNALTGNEGNNTLDGGAGADTMVGGAGDDIYVVDNAGDTATEAVSQGTDTVRSSVDWTLGANFENLELTGLGNINGTGNSAANMLTGNGGDNVLDGGAGADSMAGGAGNDTYVVDVAGDLVTEGADAGTDTVRSAVNYALGANLENLTLTGAGNINGTGNDAANILTGNSGNNTLNGGAGADTMAGGAGNDTYVVDAVGDTVTEAEGEGTDLVRASVSYTLSANVENLTLTGTKNINGTGNALENVLTGNAKNNVLDGGAGADTMVGGAGNDTYVADNAGDVVVEADGGGTDLVQASVSYTLLANVENLMLTGSGNIDGTGNDLANVLTGNSGDNVLDGGAGADSMAGGLGNDTYVVDNAGDVVSEAGGGGTDTILSSVTWTLGGGVENLTLTGAGNIDATGNNAANVLIGNSGSNLLDGSRGADTMAGGGGDDIYVVDDAGDLVTEEVDAGIDLVRSAVNYTLTANVENLTLTGGGKISGTGNGLANVLTGNSGNNVLDGGAGVDTMVGGAGNDTYVVDNSADVVTEEVGDGTDLVRASASYMLAANVENLTLTGTADIDGTGNGLSNVLTGNAGANRLDGGAGADRMVGGAGNDTYVVDVAGDVVKEAANEGTDTVESSVTWALGANLENLTLTGTADINGTGNALANVLIGNSGNNVLDGLGGIDDMAGGLGDDTYVVDVTDDVVTEADGEGTDLVRASASYTLSANVENLTLTGSGNIDGTGNDLANVLTGNSGDNVLDGGAGADSMAGGLGNDTYVVDNAGDVVSEAGGGGTDTILSSVTWVLGGGLENLTLTGVGNINATGNNAANVLIGNSGNNLLHGRGGADTMAGGGGDDIYVVDDAGDLVTEGADAGIDVVWSEVNYALTANVENLLLRGSSDINGTGNDMANVLTGNAGNNVLDGGAGADTMVGGAGNDTYVVDAVDDVVTESASQGTDLVQSTASSYVLSANVENLTLMGSGDINGTGNELANTLTGNAGNNVLTGGGGNDTMVGGGGVDTAVYAQSINASMVTANGSGGWTVATGGAEGTDTLAGIEKVDGAEDGQILLVGNGGFATIQAAIDAASAGDTILVAAGEYEGNVLIDKAVTLRGANAGIDGNGTRGAESVILGKIDVTASAAVTIDGFEVLNTGATTGGGPTNPALWFATGGSGAGHLVTHTVFNSIVAGGANGVDDRAIGMGPIATGAVRIEDNLFTGASDGKYGTASWGRGIWSDGGGVTLSITGNEFHSTRSSINYDGPDGASSAHLTIEGNTFDVAGTAMSFAAGGDVTGITGNTFNDVDTDFNFQNISNAVTLDLGATENLPTDGQPMVVLGGSAADTITGSVGTDVLQGNGGADTLNGGGGDDNLSGGAGDDILDGGTGADAMAGGADNDTYVVDNAGDVVTEAASAGTDLVQSSIDYTLGDNLENLTLVGAAIVGSGNSLNNTIVGNAQDNELDGGGGDDTMVGGLGNDTYVIDSIGDVVTEGADAGTDLVRASVSYTLSANVENLTLTGMGNIDATGNGLANVLTGNAGANTLDGGAGVDTMAGGLGDDTYVVDVTGDVVTEGGEGGTDLVRASASYTLSANVENLTLTGTADIDGTGNGLANVLTGNDGANLLDGGLGADTMAGGLGNDTYVVDNAGDVVTEEAAGGTDTVHSSISYALGLNLENLTLTGDAIYGTGNDAANVIIGNLQDNELDGGSGDDVLDGGDGSDTLTGGIGNDTLDGGAGADLLIGGSGNDTYFVDDAGDIVSESGGPGIDAVFASINYTLGSNVENLTLTGESNLNGTGNGLANTITGNAGDNLINGKQGNDTLTGGGGNDSFVFDTPLNGTTNVDQITDFGVGNDVFNLAHSVFAQISVGVLSESAFHVGASATDADQRIIYDQTSGQVMYDADGNGGGAAVQFAAVTAGTLLTHDDFFVL